MTLGQMQIDRRVIEAGVSEEQLDGAQVSSRLQQMSREGMPQRMRSDILLDTSPAGSSFNGMVDRFGGKVRAFRSSVGLARKEILAGFLPAPVFSQGLQQHRAERDVSVSAALSLPDVNHHALAVNVADLETGHLCTAHARRVKDHQQGAMQEGSRSVNHPLDLVLAEDDG